MAVKALTRIYDFAFLENGDFTVYQTISANGAVHYGIDCGTYASDGLSATINLALKAAAKAYAISDMGATFALGDTVRQVDGGVALT